MEVEFSPSLVDVAKELPNDDGSIIVNGVPLWIVIKRGDSSFIELDHGAKLVKNSDGTLYILRNDNFRFVIKKLNGREVRVCKDSIKTFGNNYAYVNVGYEVLPEIICDQFPSTNNEGVILSYGYRMLHSYCPQDRWKRRSYLVELKSNGIFGYKLTEGEKLITENYGIPYECSERKYCVDENGNYIRVDIGNGGNKLTVKCITFFSEDDGSFYGQRFAAMKYVTDHGGRNFLLDYNNRIVEYDGKKVMVKIEKFQDEKGSRDIFYCWYIEDGNDVIVLNSLGTSGIGFEKARVNSNIPELNGRYVKFDDASGKFYSDIGNRKYEIKYEDVSRDCDIYGVTRKRFIPAFRR